MHEKVLRCRRLDCVSRTLVAAILGCAIVVALSGQGSAQERPAGKANAGAESTGQNQTLDLTEQVIQDVLEKLQAGIQGHRRDQTLSVFDPESADYAHLRGELGAFFGRYSDAQFRYKILQLTSDKDSAFVTAEVDLDANPTDENLMELRRSTQMQFQLRNTAKGWKVVTFSPANFFEQ